MLSRVCVGEIVGAHGVRGIVKLRSFTLDPAAIVSYGPLEDEKGERRFTVALQSIVRDCWLARINGVDDRNASEALRGTKLYVDRAALPQAAEDEFYHADLIGLRAEWADGRGVLGTVSAVHDYGGGTLLELALADGGSMMLPFTQTVVPVVDVAGGRLVVDPPVVTEW